MLTVEDVQRIWNAAENGDPIPFKGDLVFSGMFTGKLYSKGRPRFGKGHTYTPKNTLKFERTVKDWAQRLIVKPVSFPIKIDLKMFDNIPRSYTKIEREAAEYGVIFSTVGDVDNRAKAILDAVNGVIYNDDRQIVDLRVSRQFGSHSGFNLEATRAGISPNEFYNFRNVVAV